MNRKSIYIFAIAVITCGALSAQSTTTITQQQRQPRKTENVILIVADGLRWQEVFGGMQRDLATTTHSVSHPEDFLARYDAETSSARRQILMPFLWSHVATHGQIYGNREKNSPARVLNTMHFSYPGYNEMISGAPDDKRISSNRKIPNPNTHVFEWLAAQDFVSNRVFAAGAWDVYPYIFNTGRVKFPVDSGAPGFSPSGGTTPAMDLVNHIRKNTHNRWSSATFDSLIFPMFTEYVQHHKPRVMFLSLGETDEWAHEGNYERYVESAQRVDRYLTELWELLQTMPQYHDKTTIIFTSDHGRGSNDDPNPKAWNSHAANIAGCETIFMAVWGPDTPPLGERENVPEVTLSQAAATLAHALGYDYRADHPHASPPLTEAVTTR